MGWETDCLLMIQASNGPLIVINGCSETIDGYSDQGIISRKMTEFAKLGYRKLSEVLEEF